MNSSSICINLPCPIPFSIHYIYILSVLNEEKLISPNSMLLRWLQLTGLQLVHFLVDTFEGQELVVGARFDDAALVKDVDAVCILDSREAVGNGDGGSAHSHLLERMLDDLFRFRINIGSGLIQNQNLRLGSDRSGKGDELALAR